MKNRNIYKAMVMCFLICIAAVLLIRLGKAYAMEQKSYGFTMASETELTEETASELKNIAGILKFEPVYTIMVTIELEEYTMQAELKGIELTEYPLKWKSLQKEFSMGNTPVLFLGENSFASFTDKNGNSPGKSEIEWWEENYAELSLYLTDEKGNVRKGKICGILKSPENIICMEQSQMKEVFGKSASATGGYMQISGYENWKKAKEVLQNAGFIVEDK